MQVTEVRMKRVEDPTSKVRAYVAVTLDDSLVIHNIRVVQGQKGLFIAMPSRRLGTGEFKDIVHPINSEFRSYLKDAILAAFREADSE